MINSEQFIPCPACDTKVPFDIKQLLKGFKFSCPECSAAIGIANESVGMVEESIEKLDRLKQKRKN